MLMLVRNLRRFVSSCKEPTKSFWSRLNVTLSLRQTFSPIITCLILKIIDFSLFLSSLFLENFVSKCLRQFSSSYSLYYPFTIFVTYPLLIYRLFNLTPQSSTDYLTFELGVGIPDVSSTSKGSTKSSWPIFYFFSVPTVRPSVRGKSRISTSVTQVPLIRKIGPSALTPLGFRLFGRGL